jgi:hypothetical protein
LAGFFTIIGCELNCVSSNFLLLIVVVVVDDEDDCLMSFSKIKGVEEF